MSIKTLQSNGGSSSEGNENGARPGSSCRLLTFDGGDLADGGADAVAVDNAGAHLSSYA